MFGCVGWLGSFRVGGRCLKCEFRGEGWRVEGVGLSVVVEGGFGRICFYLCRGSGVVGGSRY